MSYKSELVHQAISRLGLSSIPVFISRYSSKAIRFIPQNHHFSKNDQIEVVRDGVIFKVNRSDYMQWYLWANLVDHNFSHCQKHRRPGTLVIDVGSNIGVFSLKIARLLQLNRDDSAKVIAVEANPKVAEMLRQQIALNPGFAHQVDVWELALGDKECQISFASDQENTGGGHIVESISETKSCISVPMKRLDDLVDAQGLGPVGVLKIDVEGFEPEVLAGAQRTIKRDRPVLYLEVTDHWIKARGHSAFGMLSALNQKFGYTFQIDRGTTLQPFDINLNMVEQLNRDEIQYNVLGLPPASISDR